MMPGEDGLALCRMIRETTEIPVILLTAMVEETDRVVGLEIGADDYVTKPFSPRELLARIKAVLRRSKSLPRPATAPEKSRLHFDRWTLDTLRRELVGEDDVAVPLSTTEFRMLTVFLERPRDGALARPAPRSHQRTLARAVRALDRQPGQPTPQEDRSRPQEPHDHQDRVGRRLRARRRSYGGRSVRFPQLSFGGQLIALLLAALVAAQAMSFIVLTDDRQAAVRAANRAGLLESMASITRVLQKTPPADREALAEAASTPRIRYWVSEESATPPGPRSNQLALPALQFQRMFIQLREAPRLTVIDGRDDDDAGEPCTAAPTGSTALPAAIGPRCLATPSTCSPRSRFPTAAG